MSPAEANPPRHTRTRALLNGAFAARAVRLRRPRLEARARALAASLRTAGRPCNVIAQFCTPFAFAVHCDMLGTPERLRPELFRWSLARSGDPDAGPYEIYRAEMRLHRVVVEMLDELRHRPRAGVLAHLLRVRAQGFLSEGELTGLAASLFFDGAHLVSAQLASALLCLLVHPEQLARLRAEPEALLAPAVEEVLRYSPAIALGMTRVPAAPWAGPATAATVAFMPVNRDPSVFEAPERFDITRRPNRHLTFGRGIHHCLGAELARQELLVGLGTLLRELPGLRLAVDESRLRWAASPAIRGLITLPLAWD
ncbi:cytochrome P450 [Streptomyces halobius]|uniref:Cytochrome P450 n=1 Tax=Streptomyces halobius TaxID=2879846 RepID=A0ABY4MJF8_9ACTN|nr:cytochrome P450 [Streptomyces halobius]UQA97698.1 cytochrome P450 [Streptomyces halobius]